jgi:hypothetical protein
VLTLWPSSGRTTEYPPTHQEAVDADSRRVVAVGRHLPGNRNDCKASVPRAKDSIGKTQVIPDGGYRGTGLVIPHRREKGQTELTAWEAEYNVSHRKVRACVEHA